MTWRAASRPLIGCACPRWWGGCSTARVWDRAALYLWQAHVEAPESVPLDAELYVASQDIPCRFANPWFDLARPEAISRYRSRVDQIVRHLRAELKKEIGRAERTIRQGDAIHKVLKPGSRRLSPLGCYITALRADRHDLAERFTGAASVATSILPIVSAGKLGTYPRGLLSVRSISPGPSCRPAQAGMLPPTLN